MIAIPMRVSVSSVCVPVKVATSYQMIEGQYYEGAFEFTPSGVAQVIPTANKVVQQNFTIKPIPQNYGLITYNGSYITVS